MWIWHKKKVGGKGFLDIDLGEIQELIVTTPEEFTDNDLMEMSASEPVPDDEEEDIEEAGQGGKLTLDGSDYSRLLLTSFTTCYNMMQALKLKQMVEEGLVLYGNIFRKVKKQKIRQEL